MSPPAFASSYWKKAIECSTPAAGWAYVDIDQSNLRSVQVVIKNPAAIDWLQSTGEYSDYYIRRLSSDTAVLEYKTSLPNFKPDDFRGFDARGSFGDARGAIYYGDHIILSNGNLEIAIVQNAYSQCTDWRSNGDGCMASKAIPEKIVKNWIFGGCRSVY